MPLAHYNFLASRGQLEAHFAVPTGTGNTKTRLTNREPTKKLPVYCQQQEDSKGTYVSSVIQHPSINNHGQLSKLLDPVAAARKALDASGASAEIRIVSFLDVK